MFMNKFIVGTYIIVKFKNIKIKIRNWGLVQLNLW